MSHHIELVCLKPRAELLLFFIQSEKTKINHATWKAPFKKYSIINIKAGSSPIHYIKYVIVRLHGNSYYTLKYSLNIISYYFAALSPTWLVVLWWLRVALFHSVLWYGEGVKKDIHSISKSGKKNYSFVKKDAYSKTICDNSKVICDNISRHGMGNQEAVEVQRLFQEMVSSYQR